VTLQEEVQVVGPRAEPAGLRRVAQKAAAEAVPSSVAVRAPFPAPGVARPVPPEASVRQEPGLPRAARHEVLPAGEAAEPTDVAAAEVEAEPDVVAAAEFPVVPAGLPSALPWAAA